MIEDREESEIAIERANTIVIPYNYNKRRKFIAADKEYLIARRSSACRTLGYRVAWKMGYRYIITLDDDCRPRADWWSSWWFNQQDETRDFAGSYTSNNGWINTLHILQQSGYPRGLPFDYRDCLVKYEQTIDNNQIVAQIGLWSGCLDVGAIDKAIDDFPWRGVEISKEVPSVRVARGHVLPWSGMNYAFDVRILPLVMHWHPCEFPMMDRSDDIWMGYIAKRVIDMMGHAVLVGGNVVDHLKAGDVTNELRRERYNETISYWIYNLCDIALDLYKGKKSYLEIVEYLGSFYMSKLRVYRVPTMWHSYLKHMGSVLRGWARFLKNGHFAN